ncbi:PIN domain-containing protein [Kribbella sp. NPDC050241]|uniref:PIN domain-containing protein n=1 Tax=Kribbella sp. NPDC050241 TaxID=3364115 RepID=UPI0037A530AF
MLLGQLTTDILLSLAYERLLVPKWSAQVLDEVKRNRPAGVTAERMDARFTQMNKAFPAALTSGYDALMPEMHADPKDTHVLAAAVHSRSNVLVTENLKDFDPPLTGPHAMKVERTSTFLNRLLAENPDRVLAALHTMLHRNRREPRTMPELITKLASQHDLKSFAHNLNSVIPPHQRAVPAEAPLAIALNETTPPTRAPLHPTTTPEPHTAHQPPSRIRNLNRGL